MGDKNSCERVRGSNFSNTERQLLFILVDKYKAIIENKRTDATTTMDKNRAWLKVTEEFNCRCPDSRHRSVASLKKLYNNKKKDLRKRVAEERKERFLTGGGSYVKTRQDNDEDELVLSIMHNKTIYGLANAYDCDQEMIEDQCTVHEDEGVTDTGATKEVPFVEVGNAAVAEVIMSPSVDEAEAAHCEEHCIPAILGTPSNSTFRKNKAQTTTSRRRAASVVKPLGSSTLAEKYDQLVQKRMEIAIVEEKLKKKELEYQEEFQRLQTRSLLLDIQIKEEQLKRLRSS